MSIDADILQRLSELDLPSEKLRDVISILADSHKRTNNAERQARWRERHKTRTNVTDNVTSNATNNVITVTQPPLRACTPTRVLCGEEVNIIPPKSATHSTPTPIPAPESKITIRQPTAQSELAKVLGNELADEVVSHRKRLRAPMSSQTAARLAKDLLDSGDPNEAAKFMMDKGWKTFKYEWWKNATASSFNERPSVINGVKPNGNHGGVIAALRDIQLRELERRNSGGPLLELDSRPASGAIDRLLSKG